MAALYGCVQQTLDGETDPIRYLHGGIGGSTMMTTDEAGEPVTLGGTDVATVSYTAFGEAVVWSDVSQTWRVGGTADMLETRYQYGGALGIESGFITLFGANGTLAPLTLQDHGGQWYEADIGRLVQPSPIGGANAYAGSDASSPGLMSEIPVGDPSPGNPTPYPRPPGGRNRIIWRTVRVPARIPWWTPAVPLTGTTLGWVCVAAGVGYTAGRILDHYHPGTEEPYSDIFGRWIHERFWPKPKGLVIGPDGGMTLY